MPRHNECGGIVGSATYEQRKYALTRAGCGCYVFAGNDGRGAFVISPYDEDGSAGNYDEAGRWVPVVGRRWRLGQLTDAAAISFDADRRVKNVDLAVIRSHDYSVEWLLEGARTRQECIDHGVRISRD